MIRVFMLIWAFTALIPAYATTVIKASLNDLIDKSTSIVQGKVIGTYNTAQGPLVYTYYKIQVEQGLKGPAATQIDVQVPGGSFRGVQQNIAGVPQLTVGTEYVFFLWMGPSKTTHLLGLSQGVMDITTDASGNVIVVRQASEDLGLDSMQMKLSDLSSRVSARKGAGVK
jgi:hypothetical protein